jgi:hypothetical protein
VLECAPDVEPSKNLIVHGLDFMTIAGSRRVVYILAVMFNLTRQQQQFLCMVLLLLLVGWSVKAWRTAHPLPTARQDVL